MDLIVERGYDGISIQDITDRANVSRTTFYLHFKDKDELLFTSMQAIYDGLLRGHEVEPPIDLDPDRSRRATATPRISSTSPSMPISTG